MYAPTGQEGEPLLLRLVELRRRRHSGHQEGGCWRGQVDRRRHALEVQRLILLVLRVFKDSLGSLIELNGRMCTSICATWRLQQVRKASQLVICQHGV